MNSFENNSYNQDRGHMSQSGAFGKLGSSHRKDRSDREGFGSSRAGRDYGDNYTGSSQRDHYGGNSQSSSGYDDGFDGRQEDNGDRLPNTGLADGNFSSSCSHNDSYGNGSLEGGFETGSRQENNEYGSSNSEYGTTYSSGRHDRRESFGDKMVDKAAEYAKKKW